ncbi:dihydrodipicolinate synthase family protein [Budviciaceae bacterium BWR-B9]|uniref:Dihydrodipicolinate synthase family protein n=1 Tax=Limnobaculum allomyrinae TaxID=2791986 RepID=A0ABS1ILV8_9GAMM|nr:MULTISPECIES: dihydrodipicolinate synthase family protein [Limnobaculum]MBK5142731.1 dihydrodipicolinate synthase family protein [Limnobaculum allomyrinae]MBV7690382.1 dihydrodipicolinate synthase family protein [Limnobaculum sp. M2-1]
MADLNKFRGVFPPVPTIFHADGQLDTVGMGALIDKLVNDGVNGMLILGSGGEFCHMPKAQRFEVAEFAVKHIAGRVPVLLGISSPSTQEVIEFGLHADKLGVDAVLVLNPYYALLNEEYMYNHFRTVAESIRSPVILYNFPALTGQDISVNLIARLAKEVSNIIGIKDTVDNISHVREIINQVRPISSDFVVFSGYDEYMMDTLIMGGNGAIPATSNFASQITCGIYRAFKAKDYETMFELQRQLSRLSTVYSLETPFFGVIKQAIKLCGLNISTEVLAPVQKLSEEKKQQLMKVLTFAGIPYQDR